MERLTIRYKDGTIYTGYSLQDILKKLAKYEDLEERCIKETTWSLKELLYKWKVFYESIAELYNYRKLEEQGLLLRLPCGKGTPYWMFETQYWINEEKCKGCKNYFDLSTETFCDCDEDYPKCTQIVERHFLNTLEIVSLMSKIGKTVFLTKEEAEAALEKMKGESNA